ncbi:hypothetical protein H0H93_000197 [Arthromyces matolae]|nr:hypothetical protein H0H93_000197 [Arthromyces matolae]
MSLSKPLSLARLNDVVLGSFGSLQPNEVLDHLVRYLGTWSGSDKLFMVLEVIQYAIKLVVPFLHLRARLQYRAGLRKTPDSAAAAAYAKIGSILGDSRTLWRIWGLLPIVKWLISLERSPQPTRNLLTIERLQGWSMLMYYPLEHLSYLLSHGLIPSTIPSLASLFSSTSRPIHLDASKLSLWSTRFWAFYVLLQFAHLREDFKLLRARQRSLRKGKGTGLSSIEKKELEIRWDAYWNELVTNLAYLPLTLHWSLEKGLLKNDVWVGVFGLIAGISSFRSGWKATALPSPSSSPEAAEDAVVETLGYDLST